jgi:hypothetical protein
MTEAGVVPAPLPESVELLALLALALLGPVEPVELLDDDELEQAVTTAASATATATALSRLTITPRRVGDALLLGLFGL